MGGHLSLASVGVSKRDRETGGVREQLWLRRRDEANLVELAECSVCVCGCGCVCTKTSAEGSCCATVPEDG